MRGGGKEPFFFFNVFSLEPYVHCILMLSMDILLSNHTNVNLKIMPTTKHVRLGSTFENNI